jgi:alpha-L-rhamnosidase
MILNLLNYYQNKFKNITSMRKILLFSFILTFNNLLQGQQSQPDINPRFLKEYWDASWITHPTANLKEYGVYHFRKSFSLAERHEKFIVHVSADNRYRLFVNGKAVCFGPARGNIQHWFFETMDLAPFLNAGSNVISAEVWNFGEYIPVAQITQKTAFILQGNSETEKIVNTDESWKVIQNKSYQPIGSGATNLGEYIVVGPGDKVDGNNYPWNWQDLTFDDTDWLRARDLENGRAKGLGTGTTWDLIPREIPFMEETLIRFSSVRREEGIKVSESFLRGTESLTIPARSKVTILFDQGYETVAYPEISVSGSNGSEIELIYAEALYDNKGNKGNRNEIEGKKIKGSMDIFKVGSTNNQTFRPLWFRTFRYVQMNIKTADSPLTITNFQSVFTAYPFKENASFKCSDPELSKIWEVGWRTLRLCSNETHYDCPYYEQLQYVGDTRIQCLISAYVSGDDRLTRQAIQAFNRSRFYEGLTVSRYPTNDMQVIPPFSLFWTNMVHDYWMHYTDTAFVKSMLFGIENVLHWYEERIDPKTGMLGPTPYWNFVDWPKEWPWSMVVNSGGVPRGGAEGGSSILSFQLAYALNEAAELFQYFGRDAKADYYKKMAGRISAATVKLCWDNSRMLMANTPEMDEYSQHANIMAILSNAPLPIDAKELIDRVSKDETIIQATVYYRFYLLQAMKKAGLADQYVEMLGPWRDMLHLGLTTFAEKPEPSRSDCHAWSASPNYDLLATVCGIEPAGPGFGSVKIEPHLGSLQWIEGSMPHAKGMIRVKFSKNAAGGLEGEIELPAGLRGTFVYKNRSVELVEGRNIIKQ